jgi:hypothetical protein
MFGDEGQESKPKRRFGNPSSQASSSKQARGSPALSVFNLPEGEEWTDEALPPRQGMMSTMRYRKGQQSTKTVRRNIDVNASRASQLKKMSQGKVKAGTRTPRPKSKGTSRDSGGISPKKRPKTRHSIVYHPSDDESSTFTGTPGSESVTSVLREGQREPSLSPIHEYADTSMVVEQWQVQQQEEREGLGEEATPLPAGPPPTPDESRRASGIYGYMCTGRHRFHSNCRTMDAHVHIYTNLHSPPTPIHRRASGACSRGSASSTCRLVNVRRSAGEEKGEGEGQGEGERTGEQTGMYAYADVWAFVLHVY